MYTDLNRKKIAIIGSGFGGLAAAVRLQSAGHQVTLFEKRDKPGGRAYVYHDKGFTFDAGPTVITAPEALEEIFLAAGRKLEDYVELLPVFPFYRLFWENGYQFDYDNNLQSTLDQIRQKSPGDEKGYLAFLKYAEEVFKHGYTGLAHVPFLSWSSMVKAGPRLASLQAYRSVYSIVSKYIKDPELRQTFSFHTLLVGGNPFSTSSIYTLIHFLERKWGVSFPRGGTGALVRALVKLFEELGGQLTCSANVSEIVTENSRVQGLVCNGQFARFDIVVSNADVVHTYSELLKKDLTVKRSRRKVLKQSQSMSLFLIYFGVNRQYPELAHHNILFGPRFKDHLAEIFGRGKQLPEDFSLYLHAPSRTDATMAPPGCEAFYVLAPVPHLGHVPLNWESHKRAYADTILKYIEDHYAPNLRQHIVTERIFTPQDFKEELNAHLGAAFSTEPILRQSAYFRTHNRDPYLKGLYFVGAGTHPGAGVPGVVNSAKATSQLIIEDLNTGRLHQTKRHVWAEPHAEPT